jgi:hypothetical protein
MRRLFITLLIFTATSFGSRAQQFVFEKTDSVSGTFSAFSIDNFGRVTLVNKDVILSLSNKLDTLFSTSLKSFRPTTVESSKSFRTLLFDQERSVIHFLDNTMTDIHGEIDLVNLDIQQPWLVCESFGGNTIWVFDAGAMRLIRLNENLEKVMVTENLVTVFGDGQLPVKMMEAHDRLFALISGIGIAIFDVFGTYMTTIPCTAKTFDVYNGYLLFQEENQIRATSIQFDGNPDQLFPVPFEFSQFKFSSEKVYFLTSKGLVIGKFVLKN